MDTRPAPIDGVHSRTVDSTRWGIVGARHRVHSVTGFAAAVRSRIILRVVRLLILPAHRALHVGVARCGVAVGAEPDLVKGSATGNGAEHRDA